MKCSWEGKGGINEDGDCGRKHHWKGTTMNMLIQSKSCLEKKGENGDEEEYLLLMVPNKRGKKVEKW